MRERGGGSTQRPAYDPNDGSDGCPGAAGCPGQPLGLGLLGVEQLLRPCHGVVAGAVHVVFQRRDGLCLSMQLGRDHCARLVGDQDTDFASAGAGRQRERQRDRDMGAGQGEEEREREEYRGRGRGSEDITPTRASELPDPSGLGSTRWGGGICPQPCVERLGPTRMTILEERLINTLVQSFIGS